MKTKSKSVIPRLPDSPFAPVEVVDNPILRTEDRAFLEKREKIIEAGRKLFLEVGKALIEIRDYQSGLLYKRYGTFEAYCQERWEFGKAYAYRLMGAAKIAEELSPRGDEINLPAPEGEKQIRVLSLLGMREDRRAAWKQANEEAGDKEISAAGVSKVVRQMLKSGAKRCTPEKKKPNQKPRALRIAVKDLSFIRKRIETIRRTAAAAVIAVALEEIEGVLPS